MLQTSLVAYRLKVHNIEITVFKASTNYYSIQLSSLVLTLQRFQAFQLQYF